MGDDVTTGASSRTSSEVIEDAKVAAEATPDPDHAASVSQAIEAAHWDLSGALPRLGVRDA